MKPGLAAAAVLTLACGGSAGGPAVAPVSPARGAVTAIGSMSVARAVHTSTLLRDGRVLITGGFDDAGSNHATAELFDPVTDRFLPAARMQSARVDHTATLLADGRVLIAGGLSGEALSSAELYDPAADRFEPTGRLGTARNGHKAVRLADGRVLIVGGDVAGAAFLASAEVYDPRTGTFTPTGSMAIARSSHTATLLPDGQVLVTGGHQGRQSAIQIHATAELYDPVAGSFRPTGAMTRVRHKHDAAPLGGGGVLIVGGTDARDDVGAYDSVERYDPAAGRFSAAGQMGSPRYKIQDTTISLPNDQVLVAGGAAQAELYDPANGLFARISGEFGDSPLFATATLLLDGRVLITGGYGLHSRARANAWIYAP